MTKDNEIIIRSNTSLIYFLLCDHQLTNIRFIIGNVEMKIYQYGEIIRLTPNINSEDITNYGVSIPFGVTPKLNFDSPYSNKITISIMGGDFLRTISGLTGSIFRS